MTTSLQCPCLFLLAQTTELHTAAVEASGWWWGGVSGDGCEWCFGSELLAAVKGWWWHRAKRSAWHGVLNARRVDSMRHTWLQVPRKRWEIFTQVSLFIAEYHSHLTYVWAQSDRLDHASFGWGGVGHVEHNSNVYSPLKQFGSNSLRHISATNNRKMEHLVWRLSSIYSNEWPDEVICFFKQAGRKTLQYMRKRR